MHPIPYIVSNNIVRQTIQSTTKKIYYNYHYFQKSGKRLDNSNIGGPGFYIAHIDSALNRKVTFVAPFRSPRISDNPIRSVGSS